MIGPEPPPPLQDRVGIFLVALVALIAVSPPAWNALSQNVLTYTMTGSVMGYPGARYAGASRDVPAGEVEVGLWDVEASSQRPMAFPKAPVVACLSAECRAFFPGRRVELRCYVEYSWDTAPRREICVFVRDIPDAREGDHVPHG